MNLPITPTRSDRRRWLGLVALPAAMAVFMATVQAQDAFPTRAITILVPYSAGGPTDQVARQFAVELGKAMGQPVVVENRTGASGLLAMQALARAPADGYLVGIVWNPVDARSEIQIFDCRDARLAQGPVARVILPRRVPHGFNATYISQKNLERWR